MNQESEKVIRHFRSLGSCPSDWSCSRYIHAFTALLFLLVLCFLLFLSFYIFFFFSFSHMVIVVVASDRWLDVSKSNSVVAILTNTLLFVDNNKNIPIGNRRKIQRKYLSHFNVKETVRTVDRWTPKTNQTVDSSDICQRHVYCSIDRVCLCTLQDLWKSNKLSQQLSRICQLRISLLFLGCPRLELEWHNNEKQGQTGLKEELFILGVNK